MGKHHACYGRANWMLQAGYCCYDFICSGGFGVSDR